MRTLRGYCAFIPNSLPPHLEFDDELIKLLSDADRLLGELSGTGRILKNPYLLISPYIRREAVSSSKIEGTLSSLSDLFYYEASEEAISKNADVKEVFNYVQTITKGLELLAELPISTRLICGLHAVLMAGVRGEHGTPGELRRSQNWIGPPGCTLEEAIYIPPPVEEMGEALSSWEKYVNSDPREPVLIQTALMHYQFEAIHPFIDGNGRIGRVLITLFLCQKEALAQPLLFLSEFFEKYRSDYYAHLLAVSQRGDWNGWLKFFLRGVISMSRDALKTAKEILDLHERFSGILNKAKVPEIAHRLLDVAFTHPLIAIAPLSRKWNVEYTSIRNGMRALIKLGILSELTGRQRNRLYASQELLKILKVL